MRSMRAVRKRVGGHFGGYSTEVFSRTIDVHVGTLRQKIEPDPKKPQLILTVPGLGYKFMG